MWEDGQAGLGHFSTTWMKTLISYAVPEGAGSERAKRSHPVRVGSDLLIGIRATKSPSKEIIVGCYNLSPKCEKYLDV
ncbi:MAG: hypothetical protein ACE5R6_17415 [Candidatus Heimdallarchaeota archaeon]